MSRAHQDNDAIQRTLECIIDRDLARKVLDPGSDAALRLQIEDRIIWIQMGAIGLFTQVCRDGKVASERYCKRGWITVTAREADEITVEAKPDFQQRSPPLAHKTGESA